LVALANVEAWRPSGAEVHVLRMRHAEEERRHQAQLEYGGVLHILDDGNGSTAAVDRNITSLHKVIALR